MEGRAFHPREEHRESPETGHAPACSGTETVLTAGAGRNGGLSQEEGEWDSGKGSGKESPAWPGSLQAGEQRR